MHIIKLHITGKGTRTKEFFEYANYYFESLFDTKQIINKEWQYESVEDGVCLNLFCPERKSYAVEYTTKYGKKWKRKIEEELDCQLDFSYLGIDPELGVTKIAKNPKFLILKTAGISPLIDGESFNLIPLYKIPYTYHDGECYDDINFWERNYERIEGLWFNGAVGEKWCQNQLQNHDSELSRQGIKCCQKIEEVTGIATFYYLFNYRAWGRKKDEERKCPQCGGDWLIEGATFNDTFAFKCEKCRIISELSSNK